MPLSATVFNAAPEEVLNLIAPEAVQPLAPEYPRLVADLRQQLGDRKLAEARESGGQRDLTLLRQATGWDARLIALAATADRLSAETRIQPDALYGLLRVGLPMGREHLAHVGEAVVEKALRKSREAGIVPLDDAQIAAATRAYAQFARETRRAEKAPGALSSLGTLFDKSGLSGAERTKFEDLYLAHRGSSAELWDKARASGIAGEKVNGLRLQGKLAYLTGNNAELTEKLQQEIGAPENLGRLVEKDLHRADAWKSRLTTLSGNSEEALQKLIPPAYLGAKTADRLEAYAADLARQVRVSFPTKVVSRMIATDELRLGEAHAAVKEPVQAFLRNAEPLGFALGNTPLDAFVAQHREKVFAGVGEAQRAETMESVKRLQRLYQITPGDESLKTLSALGFSSAHDVTEFSEDKFVDRFGHQFASIDEARLIARKARQVTTAVYSFFTAAKQLDSAPLVYALSPPADKREEAKNALIKHYPSMETLFGSLDYCECEHCRSVLSPAAYLVDLLEFVNPAPLVWQSFLDEWRGKHGGKAYDGAEYGYLKPFDALVGTTSDPRRQDLPHLPLTCENTHTALPYIDVVNEILEYFVANDKLEAAAARDTGAATTAELLAEPQNLLPEAYAKLEAARYPLALPFDLWLETVRRFCEHFETPLWQVLEAFRTTDKLFSPNPPESPRPNYYRAEVFVEQLGLSPAECAIFTAADPLANWHLLFGFDDPAKTPALNQQEALTALKSAKTLSRRLGVSYKELVELVRSGFVNPQLEALVLLCKLDLEVADVFRYKGHASYPALTADERAAFVARLDAATATFSATGFDAKAWLDTAWQAGRFDQVLLLASPSLDCNFEKTILRFANTADADGLVFLKLHWLVRLWRKLGWKLAETDRAVQAFLPRNSLPLTGANAGAAWQTALLYLSHLRALEKRVAAGRSGRLALVTLWSDLPTTGDAPLYARLFLTPGVLKNDLAFDDPLGQYLSPAGLAAQAQARQHEASLENVAPTARLDPTAFASQPKVTVEYDALLRVQRLAYQGVLSDADKASLAALSSSPALAPLLEAVQARGREFTLIKGHLLALQGALGLTADEIGRILTDAGFDPATAPLSLENVSLLHRHGVLARALKLSVRDLLALKALSGLDPCRPLSADPLADLAQDHPFSQTLRFVEIAGQVHDSGFQVEALEYLLRHRLADPVGPYRAQAEPPLALVKTLASEIRRIRIEHAIPADPASLSDELLAQKLALVLPPEAVATFLAMWTGTAEFAVLEENVAPAGKLAPEDFTGEPAIQVRYDADAVRKPQRLTYRGVLLDAGVGPLKAAHPSALFGRLLDQAQAQMKAFFEKHFVRVEPPFLAAGDFDVLFAPILAALTEPQQQEKLTEKRAKLTGAFLPFLQQKLARQIVVQTLAASLNADAAFIAALVNGTDLLSDPAQPGRPLFEAFADAGSSGLSTAFFASTDATGAPSKTSTVATADTAALEGTTPARPAGTNSVRFEGWVEAPASGAFRFTARCGKKDAEVELRFAHRPDPVFRGKAATDGEEIGAVVELQAGLLYHLTFEVRVLGGGEAALLVQGDNQPRQSLDQWSLHPAADVERVRRAQVLLAKTLQLVQGLALNEREVRHLRAHAADFDGLDFSTLPTREADDSPAGAVVRFGQFLRLAGYASLKRSLAITDDALIGLFENARRAHPAATDANQAQSTLLDDVCKRFGDLTRRELSAVRAVAVALGFRTESVLAGGELRVAAPDFAQEKALARLWEALRLVETLGIPVSAIVRCTGIVHPGSAGTERFAIARDLRHAVKARFEPETWQRVAQPIFDKLRQRQRDALVAFILPRRGFERVEQLFEYFLIDPGMEPVVQTSRLRLAISSVQTFIQRCLLNLEPQVHPSAINAQHWEWMKRYRVWEANRKIFLFPENWLEPEFRDDKTHLFQELEGALLQGDVSNDLVEDAFFRYLKQLETIARLEMVTMYAEERPLGSNILHLIGRTFSSPHKYFYRRYSNGMWTPWEPVGVEIEGDHVAAVIWRERLHLFWLTFMEKAKEVNTAHTVDPTTAITIPAVPKEVEIQLNWSELFQGEWTTREAGGFGKPLRRDILSTFDRRNVFIHVSKRYEDGEERGVQINLEGALNGAFMVVNKNSPPDANAYSLSATIWPYSQDFDFTAVLGTWALQVSFTEKIVTENSGIPKFMPGKKHILQKGGAFSLLQCSNLATLTEEDLFALISAMFGSPPAGMTFQEVLSLYSAAERKSLVRPFFYQDNRHTFFVEPTLTETTTDEWDDYVVRPPIAVKPERADDPWKDLEVKVEVPRREPVPIPKGDPRAIFEESKKGDWVTNPTTGIEFGESIVVEAGGLDLAAHPRTARGVAVERGASAAAGRMNIIGAGGFTNRR